MSVQNPAAWRSIPRIGVLLALVILTACSTPYVDSRREAGKRIMVGTSNKDVIAICYGGGAITPAITQLADSKCAETGRVAQYSSKVHLACNILAPTRVYFKCVAPPAAAPAQH